MAAFKTPVAGIVLAAGKGTRMQSDLPKVLHTVGGSPMLERVIEAMRGAGVSDICLVLSRNLDPFSSLLTKHRDLRVCVQKEQKGTADAVGSAAYAFKGIKAPSYVDGELLKGTAFSAPYVLICLGDMPALNSRVLKPFVDRCLNENADLALIAMRHPQPKGYGRVVQDVSGDFLRIVEEKDAKDDIKAVNLCNTGIIMARTEVLFDILKAVTPHNAQGEYYLTDCFAIAKSRGKKLLVHITDEYRIFDGINDRQQLEKMEAWLASQT